MKDVVPWQGAGINPNTLGGYALAIVRVADAVVDRNGGGAVVGSRADARFPALERVRAHVELDITQALGGVDLRQF